MIHRSCENFPFLTTENRFDVHLTDKMTEFDQIKHRFGILTKILLTNNRGTLMIHFNLLKYYI